MNLEEIIKRIAIDTGKLESEVRAAVIEFDLMINPQPKINVNDLINMSAKMNREHLNDHRFNAQPEKSTFTPKIHNRSKRWQR